MIEIEVERYDRDARITEIYPPTQKTTGFARG
jgi:alkylation response protein AidB-like acyl-CoA dehydrogenase